MEAADLLERAAAFLEPASGVAAQQSIVRQLEPAGQLLVRKVDVEAKYLNRLEGRFHACIQHGACKFSWQTQMGWPSTWSD